MQSDDGGQLIASAWLSTSLSVGDHPWPHGRQLLLAGVSFEHVQEQRLLGFNFWVCGFRRAPGSERRLTWNSEFWIRKSLDRHVLPQDLLDVAKSPCRKRSLALWVLGWDAQ